MKWEGTVRIDLKETVFDPQGDTLRRTLVEQGYPLEKVRVGKVINVELEASDQKNAEQILQEICSRLLANPVMESFSFSLEKIPS